MSTQPEQAAEILEQIVALINERVPQERRAQVESFARQYYRRVAPEDLVEREPDDLYGAVMAHLRTAQRREPRTAKVHVYSPRFEEHGWRSVHSIVEIVTDDMPFLVDSVAMELNRHGLVIHLPIHPVLAVRRDDAGELLEVLPADTDEGDGVRESFIHVEVDRQSEPEVLQRLTAGLERVLADVRAATEDWEKIRDQVRRILDEFAAGRTPKPGPQIARQFSAPVGGPTTLTDPSLYRRANGEPAPDTAQHEGPPLQDERAKRPGEPANVRDAAVPQPPIGDRTDPRP